MRAALAAVCVAAVAYVVGRRHGRTWECRDRLAAAIEDAVEAGVVEVAPTTWGPCGFCLREFPTMASALRHHELVARGIRCEGR